MGDDREVIALNRVILEQMIWFQHRTAPEGSRFMVKAARLSQRPGQA